MQRQKSSWGYKYSTIQVGNTMNERIKELSKQAEIYALTLVDREDDYVEVFEQKFAELIVRESIAMCDELRAQYFTSRKSTMDFD